MTRFSSNVNSSKKPCPLSFYMRSQSFFFFLILKLSSMMMTTLQYSNTPIKPFITPKIYPLFQKNNPSSSCLLTTKAIRSLVKFQSTHNSSNYYGQFKKTCIVKAQDDNKSGFITKGEKDDTKKAADAISSVSETTYKPAKWPWIFVLAFLLYAWRSVLFELYNIYGELVLEIIYNFSRAIYDPLELITRHVLSLVNSIVRYYLGDSLETTFHTIQSLMMTSSVIAIAEATVPNSVNGQSRLLTIAGLIGLSYARGNTSYLVLWTLLLGFSGYSSLVKDRDYVSSVLPVAAVLVAVGKSTWVRLIVMASFITLAVFQYYHYSNYYKDDPCNLFHVQRKNRRIIPCPLLSWIAFAIAIRLAMELWGSSCYGPAFGVDYYYYRPRMEISCSPGVFNVIFILFLIFICLLAWIIIIIGLAWKFYVPRVFNVIFILFLICIGLS